MQEPPGAGRGPHTKLTTMAFKNKRTGRTLSQDLKKSEHQYRELVAIRLPEKAEQLLLKVVRGSFVQQKYVDGKSSKWEKKKKENGNKILHGATADLSKSFETEIRKAGKDTTVSIGTDVVYAQIHNEGLMGKAFGKYSFKMPKRQFMPMQGEEHPVVNRALDYFMDKEMDKIFR